MKQIYKTSLLTVFLGYIVLFSLLNIVLPDRAFSEQENRYLQQAPKFTPKALFDGSFTEDFERYITDQFPFRDRWTALKARYELLTGKAENNDVFYCENDTLIKRFTAPDTGVLDENTSYINTFSEKVSSPVFVSLIPGAGCIEEDELPEHAPTDDQSSVIDYVYSRCETETVDIVSTLSQHADEYIYYRSDHHWTSLGAYYGFSALGDALGFKAPPLSSYDRETVTDTFYGTVYSSSGFSWVKPDSIETFVPDTGSVKITNYNTSEPSETPLYDTEKLSEKDKYSMFLGGNSPRIVIETGTPSKGKLLIIRDSYTDSLLPFLLSEYSEIHLLDLRYYKNSVSLYANENGFDAVLILYSVENFCTDQNLFMLSM